MIVQENKDLLTTSNIYLKNIQSSAESNQRFVSRVQT